MMISRERFEALAHERGFIAVHHQAGAYERLNGYLRKAMKRTLSAALLTIPLDDDEPDTVLELNAAARKCARFYDWSVMDKHDSSSSSSSESD